MKERLGHYIPEDFKQDDPFSDAFNSQIEETVKPEKVRVVKMSAEERKKGERDFKHREQTKKVLADFDREERRKIEIEKSKTPEAQARHKARMAAFDMRTEQRKAQKPEAVARHRKVLDNFDSRTDDILAEKSRTKLKMWKNLVETYLAGGEEAVEAELFDPNRGGKTLTREMLEKDLPLQKQLAVMFAADSRKRTIEDFIVSMPTEEEYVVNITKKINTKDNDKDSDIVSGEINNADQLSVRLPSDDILKELKQVRRERDKEEFLVEFDNVQTPVEKNKELALAEQAQDEYVKAYRAYDSKATKDKSDDQVASLRPPFFAFGGAAKNLKKLYTAMVERNNVATLAMAPEQIGKNLAASDLFKTKSEIRPELLTLLKESNEHEERAVTAPQYRADNEVDKFLGELESPDHLTSVNKFLAEKPKPGSTLEYLRQVQKRSGMNPEFSTPLTKALKGKNIEQALGYLQDKKGRDMERRLSQIEDYFIEKNKIPNDKVHEFLMETDIRGWFKGDQKKLQKEYRALYTNAEYQAWVRQQLQMKKKK